MNDFRFWVARKLLQLSFWFVPHDLNETYQSKLANQFQLLILKLEADAALVEPEKNI